MRSRIVQGFGVGILSLCLTLAASGTCRAQQCVGDCNGDGVVTVNELITDVNIDLGVASLGDCPAINCNTGLGIYIDCLVLAVNNALSGCLIGTPRPSATPTVAPTPTPTIDIIDYCGLRENVGGCCDFFGQQPCQPLVEGQDAAQCRFDGGYPTGCDGSVTCNGFTGHCETMTPTRTCAASPPPTCSPGEGLACEDQQCTVNCRCATVTPTPTPRFLDNGDGTITDRNTRLVWEKKVGRDGTPSAANLNDADNDYPWCGYCTLNAKYCQPNAAASVACSAGVEGDVTGCAQCLNAEGTCYVSPLSYVGARATIWDWLSALNATNFAGHSDWRVPTRDELQSIVDYSNGMSPPVDVAFQGASCGGACTDVTSAACSCTQPTDYWSASTDASFPRGAWRILFIDGGLSPDDKTDISFVRAVRGGS